MTLPPTCPKGILALRTPPLPSREEANQADGVFTEQTRSRPPLVFLDGSPIRGGREGLVAAAG